MRKTSYLCARFTIIVFIIANVWAGRPRYIWIKHGKNTNTYTQKLPVYLIRYTLVWQQDIFNDWKSPFHYKKWDQVYFLTGAASPHKPYYLFRCRKQKYDHFQPLENLSPDESPESDYAHSPRGKSKEPLPGLLIPHLCNLSRANIPTMTAIPS